MAPQRNALERPTYRPDVDGLRAVAVLLVLADHFGIRLRGGYIGVDIFFVISGYLISGIILSELAQERFSIVRFYERRIRRIFPALLAVIAFVTVMAYRLFVPSEVEAYARSLLATLFSVSNFFFWHQAGYFDEASLIKPLLHTWSLAVEEQFYIIFPLFLLAARRFFPKRLKAAIIGITIVSFVAAVLTVHSSATAAFYFAPLRAWELLIGTIVSQGYLPRLRGAVVRNVASISGFLLIFIPALIYSSKTSFPGLAALWPCLGAALIIAAGETGSSFVGWLLSLRPVVFVGLISYSVYLWHWPILVFERTSSFLGLDLTSNTGKVLLVALSLAIGALSWALIEQPFRKGRFRPDRRMVFLINGVAAAAVAAVAIGLIAAHGVPNRFPEDAQKVGAFMDYYRPAQYREGTCFIGPASSFSDFRKDICLPSHPGRRSILLAGDSHAAALWPGFSSVFIGDDIQQANVSGCRPLVGDATSESPDCQRLLSFLFDDYLLHNHVDVLVLAGRWRESDIEPLARTVAFAHSHNIFVVVVGPNIEYELPLPRMLAVAMRDGNLQKIDQHRISFPQQLDTTMASEARVIWHVPYISIYKDLCNTECPYFAAPGVPLVFDNHHFTVDGSVLLAKAIQSNNQLSQQMVATR
jgi:peptidoglycan/LPS O-acetylase OafA/YrhL